MAKKNLVAKFHDAVALKMMDGELPAELVVEATVCTDNEDGHPYLDIEIVRAPEGLAIFNPRFADGWGNPRTFVSESICRRLRDIAEAIGVGADVDFSDELRDADKKRAEPTT